MAGCRELTWDGLLNGRDLGGLPVTGGRVRWGAVVRSGNPVFLSADGWAGLWAHGVRTVVDLTDGGEDGPDQAQRPAGLTTLRLPLDDPADTEFWERWGGPLTCTPLYYPAFVERFPQRIAEVVGAVATAGPGGVLVHCGSGRDRAGLIVLVLLGLLGASAEVIAADHALSHEPLAAFRTARGRADDAPEIERLITAHGTSTVEVVRSITSRDLAAHLRAAGLAGQDLAALRGRMLSRSHPEAPERSVDTPFLYG
ncbi:tyrosine-protein phosphatase [Saccharopolyspora gloriosae]|uniref:Protein tyrosine/serine phosphatase n=1 Tax=Saccharopolyspora gloriosae TaxID=455344 RepID=A0A840NR03_9PSEU|nr:tyrosine-protein phosphatase [Saccharopolyspora gloriosae]MBB5071542.1 protein tyrosine/serine phosphatase [Saccharopolyspora gloriosae]